MGKKAKIINRILAIALLTSFFLLIKIMTTQSIYTFGDSYDGDNYATIIRSGSKEEKFIALTFDDGPHPKYTLEILDLLKEYDAKATFFVLGKCAEMYPDILKRQREEGHEIGNHGYSHIDVRKASKDKIREEFGKTQNTIYSITHEASRLIRPPYGSCDDDIIDVANEYQCTIVLWTEYQDSKDWSNPGVEKIINTTISKVQNGDIILFHDYVYKRESHTVKALKTIIPKLIDEGYKFVTVSELIEISQQKTQIDGKN